MPCNTDIDLDIPDGPSGPSIPGFGPLFSFKLPEIRTSSEASQRTYWIYLISYRCLYLLVY